MDEPTFMGIDFAMKGSTMVCVASGGHIIRHDPLPPDINAAEQAERILEIVKDYSPLSVYGDNTGIGAATLDMLRGRSWESGLKVPFDGITITKALHEKLAQQFPETDSCMTGNRSLAALLALFAEAQYKEHTSHVAVLPISYEFLKRILLLPDGYEITEVQQESYRQRFLVTIRSDKFPAVKSGDRMPELTAEYHRDDNGKVTLTRIEPYKGLFEERT